MATAAFWAARKARAPWTMIGLSQIARAAESLGFDGALISPGVRVKTRG